MSTLLDSVANEVKMHIGEAIKRMTFFPNLMEKSVAYDCLMRAHNAIVMLQKAGNDGNEKQA
jgi:hypothetical protein